MTEPPRDDLDRLGALAEPVRRRLYEFVVGRGEAVDRDTAAQGVGIGRPLAAFHLDRLVRAGLLGVVFRRRSGRAGPGAGRPAKFYVRPAGEEHSVSLPPRSYDLAAEIFAAGLERPEAAAGRAAVLAAARERGREMAAPAKPTPNGRTAGGGTAGELLAPLEREGYEPFVDGDGVIRLRNCPFHVLAESHRDLTCAMNFALLDGAAGAAAAARYRAVAQPPDGRCCVAFVPSGGSDSGA
jgi:predicted ArsR family transcriptional regulator